MRGSVARIRSHASRTDASEDMSATTVAVSRPGCAATSSSRVCANRPSSRPTSTSRAPIAASPSAAARPSPEVGPVMTTVRPASDHEAGSSQSNRRRRRA